MSFPDGNCMDIWAGFRVSKSAVYAMALPDFSKKQCENPYPGLLRSAWLPRGNYKLWVAGEGHHHDHEVRNEEALCEKADVMDLISAQR